MCIEEYISRSKVDVWKFLSHHLAITQKGGTRTLQQVGQTFYAAYEKLPESIKS